jgi:hypothetical protein
VPDFWSYNLTFMIPEGTLVKAGSPVMRFDSTQIEDRLRESQAEFETAVKEREKEEKSLEVELRQLELSLVEARANLERSKMDVAIPQELVSSIEAKELALKEELERRKVELLGKKIQARRENVEAKLKLLAVKKQQRAEQRIKYNREALAKFAVRPRATASSSTSASATAIAGRSARVWMLAKVLEVADLSTLRVSAQILEVDAGRVHAGQPATVTVDAIPGRAWKSRVAEVGKLVRPRSQQDQGKVFDVFVPLDAIDAKTMRPGMSVRVEIEETRIPGPSRSPDGRARERAGAPCVVVEGSHGPEERASRSAEEPPEDRRPEGLRGGSVLPTTAAAGVVEDRGDHAAEADHRRDGPGRPPARLAVWTSGAGAPILGVGVDAGDVMAFRSGAGRCGASVRRAASRSGEPARRRPQVPTGALKVAHSRPEGSVVATGDVPVEFDACSSRSSWTTTWQPSAERTGGSIATGSRRGSSRARSASTRRSRSSSSRSPRTSRSRTSRSTPAGRFSMRPSTRTSPRRRSSSPT